LPRGPVTLPAAAGAGGAAVGHRGVGLGTRGCRLRRCLVWGPVCPPHWAGLGGLRGTERGWGCRDRGSGAQAHPSSPSLGPGRWGASPPPQLGSRHIFRPAVWRGAGTLSPVLFPAGPSSAARTPVAFLTPLLSCPSPARQCWCPLCAPGGCSCCPPARCSPRCWWHRASAHAAFHRVPARPPGAGSPAHGCSWALGQPHLLPGCWGCGSRGASSLQPPPGSHQGPWVCLPEHQGPGAAWVPVGWGCSGRL